MKSIVSGLWWVVLAFILYFIGSDLLQVEVPAGVIKVFIFYFVTVIAISVFRAGVGKYVLRRLFEGGMVVFVIATLTFGLLRTLPGGPFDEEKPLPEITKKIIEKKYGLDQPLWKQYFNYMGGLVQGDLGYSYKMEGRPVMDIISHAFPQSFKLGFYALMVAFLIGIPLGVIAASRQGEWQDTAAMFLAISGVSLPSFLVAPIFIYVFSFGKPFDSWFPQAHALLLENDLLLPVALWESPWHYILPVMTLGIRPAAFIARLTRASVLDVIQADFVRTAKAKGLAHNVILFKHVLKNSLIPVLSYAGPLVAGILTGSFVIEVIFAINGIAKYFVDSVFNRDYPMILALTLLFSIMLILANLIVDVLYKFVDPRVELS